MIRREEPEMGRESNYKAERITLVLKYIHGLFPDYLGNLTKTTEMKS